jgi:hypothetical protein
MLYCFNDAVCTEIHTKHINTLCGQNVQLLCVKLAVNIATTMGYETLKTNTEFRHRQKYLRDVVDCWVKIITNVIGYMKNESTLRFMR